MALPIQPPTYKLLWGASSFSENVLVGSDHTSAAPPGRVLTVAQYEQMHEMRREYNRFIFQAPTIVIAVLGGGLAVFYEPESSAKGGSELERLREYAVLLLAAAGFILVIGYWAFRSWVLLRQLERTLTDLEESWGHPEFLSYPYQLNKTLPLWERLPSTLMIVAYIFGLGLICLILGIVGLVL